MDQIINAADDQAELTPADESAQPISFRKLDRLETTGPSGASNS